MVLMCDKKKWIQTMENFALVINSLNGTNHFEQKVVIHWEWMKLFVFDLCYNGAILKNVLVN